MATYKLIQDIEAEDKILGPLTLRQFIFFLVGAFFAYLGVFSVVKGAAFLLIFFGPPAVFCLFFAFPFGRDQPTEVWFLAKLRFWFLPRSRIWDQSGVKELVTVTAPKAIERVLTDGLSQTEVRSRLQALANTIDSRGWAVKNVATTYTPRTISPTSDNDRLIDLNSLPQEVPDDVYTGVADDMLDTANSPLARQFNDMVSQSEQIHRQQLISQMNDTVQPAAPTNGWFMGQAGTPTAAASLPATPASPMSSDEAVLVQQLKQKSDWQAKSTARMHTVQPLGNQPIAAPAAAAPAPVAATPVSAPANPAILQLARNDDLDIATLSRQAQKAKQDEGELGTNEVEVSFH